MLIPEEYGGAGMNISQYTRTIRELAYAMPCFRSIISITIGMFTSAMKNGATEAQRQEWLPKLAAGTITSFGLTEPGSGSDSAGMQTMAVRSGDGWVLNGTKRYIIAPNKLKQGDVVENGPSADIKPGNNLPLRNIPTGTTIHAVELRPGGGAKLARSAGTSIQLLGKEGPYATLRMPSGEIRRVDVRCRATVGEVGNAEQSNINWGKAGRMRWKGKRPTVRGVVMNPVDHPHGGGEGRTSGGRHPVSPWGKPEGRTRRPGKASDKLIVRRRRTGKKR